MYKFLKNGKIKIYMTLKYQDQLNSVRDQPCPCRRKFTSKSLTAYRFMHNQASQKNFIPPALLGDNRELKCTSFALSFFRSIDEAQKKYISISKGYRSIKQRMGDHIGKIEILPTDGLASSFNTYGHMDLHPNEGIEFHNRITEYHLISTENNTTGVSTNAP